MIELELLKGLPFPWSSTRPSAYSGHIETLRRTPEEVGRAMLALERLLVLAERVAGIEYREYEDIDDSMNASVRDRRIEKAAPTFDDFTPDLMTHVPPGQREEEARYWIKVRVERMIRWIARWLDRPRDPDARFLGRELERIARPYLLRIDGMPANYLLEAIAGLRRAEARDLLVDVSKAEGPVAENARELLEILDRGR